jgi:copper resistance protein C
MTTTVKSVVITTLALTFAASAAGHTSLQSSTPASGSVLTASPPILELTFLEPARLTSLVLVTRNGERRLKFAPLRSAIAFYTSDPRLEPGRNEIHWKALSLDGHVIEGSLIIVLRVPAPAGA